MDEPAMSTTDGAAARTLHWSFDQVDSNQPDFGTELVAILRAGRNRADAAGGPALYRVLPNYWRGYRHGEPAAALANGSIEVSTVTTPGGPIEYRVTSRNDTSGEHASYSFRARDDRWRAISGAWRIDVDNSSGDQYRHYQAAGGVAEEDAGGGAIVLSVNGARIEVGRWSGSVPLTTPWALLDTIPGLEGRCDIALLEDLERLREPVRVVPIGDWRWPPSHADLGTLSGCCVHGPGLLPTYYWVDDAGTVAIVSGLFQTWVRA